MKDAAMNNQARDQQLLQIATDHLFIETLETRNSDRLDFHDVSVWAVKAALQAAFEAGQQSQTARPFCSKPRRFIRNACSPISRRS